MRRKEKKIRTRRMMLMRMIIRGTENLDHDDGRGTAGWLRLHCWLGKYCPFHSDGVWNCSAFELSTCIEELDNFYCWLLERKILQFGSILTMIT